MPIRCAFFVSLLLVSCPAFGQTPAIAPGGIVNGASFSTGPVAPGSIASIFGTNLSSSLQSASTVPLSTTLGDVSVTVNGVAAPLYFTAPDQPGTPGTSQINVQIPYEALPANAPTATMNVIVNRASGVSQPVSITVSTVAPGVFAANGHAIAINTDGTLASAPNSIPGLTTHAAAPGDVLVVYATGLGAVTPPVANGANSIDTLRRTNVTPVVTIGGVAAQVLFSGLTPQFTGVNQINVIVPAGAPVGAAVPLQVQAGSVTTSNQVTIAVGPH
jgi:uncharacterized protein (TIGR03437 family)